MEKSAEVTPGELKQELDEQPAPQKEPTREQVVMAVGSSIQQYVQARAQQLNGTQVNPGGVILDLELMRIRVDALCDELMEIPGFNDSRFGMRYVAKLQMLIKDMGKIQIARDVGNGMKNGKKR